MSLIEVLIAMAVLTVVVTAVATGMGGNLRISRENQLNNAAAGYAQGVLEEYRSLWSNPANYNACAVPPNEAQFRSQLPTSFSAPTINISDLTEDGTAFTPRCGSSTTDVAPLRQVEVIVMEGIRIRARAATRIGNPNPETN